MNSTDESSPAFGIRVTLEPTDPFSNLVGSEWHTTHWFTTETERNRKMRDMQREHEYSRRGDKPTLVFEPISRSAKT